MRSRALHILVLAWQALWLLVLVPGHTRGQILVPGSAAPAAVAHGGPTLSAIEGCCATPDAGQPERPGGRCAVCQFIASMSTPPTVVLPAAELTLLDLLPPADAPAIVARRAVRDLRARGPPVGSNV